ncbi:hypothetical protein [Iningainema tapete]|uniref:Uncharacterized protein n=1 Tax=Iningainema tapete BLCC-T55 TaxID=2748662 RepID=A0A8J6XMY5_9CYAN|nr:hypothetical protein [Iningainema tapete]MBD2774814.1 hypothetical protein [Iningainema tapete BLCC-T55]
MTEAKRTRTVRRGRIFPEIQWTEEQKAQWQAEREAFYQRSKPIFDRLKPELIKTHYNWYMAVEPESGEYFIDKDEIVAMNLSRQKHPNAPFFLFRINETGLSGTI